MNESSKASVPAGSTRHARWVKLSHWIVTVSFLTLTFTGVVILMSHPRLYWGEVVKGMKYPRRIVVKDEFDDGGKQGNIQNGWAWYMGM